MAKKRLTADQRSRVAEKIMEWGNLVFIGLVIAQAFSGGFNYWSAFAGFVLMISAYFVSIKFMKKGGGK